MPTIWTAGFNQPGYLPDNEPAAFADRVTALRYIADELYQAANDERLTPEQAGEIEVAAAALEGRDAEGGDWSYSAPDGYVYWIEAQDVTEDEAREALGEDA